MAVGAGVLIDGDRPAAEHTEHLSAFVVFLERLRKLGKVADAIAFIEIVEGRNIDFFFVLFSVFGLNSDSVFRP